MIPQNGTKSQCFQCKPASEHIGTSDLVLLFVTQNMEWMIDIYLAFAILKEKKAVKEPFAKWQTLRKKMLNSASFVWKKPLKLCITWKLNITSGFCGKCATRSASWNGHASLFGWTRESGESPEHVLQQQLRRKFRQTCDSIAVFVECIRFLRKQVTGGRNGWAGKATDMRWRF